MSSAFGLACGPRNPVTMEHASMQGSHSRSSSLIVMVQAADLRQRADLVLLGCLPPTRGGMIRYRSASGERLVHRLQ